MGNAKVSKQRLSLVKMMTVISLLSLAFCPAVYGHGSAPNQPKEDVPSAEPAQTTAEMPAETTSEKPVHLVITKRVGGLQKDLDVLAAQISRDRSQPEYMAHKRCPADGAPRYRKKVGIAGFALEQPEQGSFGLLYKAGTAVSEALYQDMLASGSAEVFHAPARLMMASLGQMPTESRLDNRLQKYSAVSREMGVQFVVSGVIRSVGLMDEEAWNTSRYSEMKRALFSADTTREFVVDVVVHDGLTGRVVMENRYSAAGRWDVARTKDVGFGSRFFDETGYGQAVQDTLKTISTDITGTLACQPMLVPILSTSGKDVILDVGTKSKLLPGDHLDILRSEHSLANPTGVPTLRDTGVSVHIHTINLANSVAWMPRETAAINVQAGDYAVIY